MIKLVSYSGGFQWFIREEIDSDLSQIEWAMEHSMEEWFLSEFFRAKTERSIEVVCDIGFHIGSIGIVMAEALGLGGKVFAVEPEVQALTLGECSYQASVDAALSQFAEMDFLYGAIGPKTGTTFLYRQEQSLANSTTEGMAESRSGR